MKMQTINSFRGKYYDFSNFAPRSVEYGGIVYGNSEACFQAQKTLDESLRRKLATMSPRDAKRFGGRRGPIKLRSDWEEAKYKLMREIVEAKFRQHPELKELLLSTGNAELIEGNTWCDNDWGACNCPKCAGEPKLNNLGIILMDVRKQFRNEI